MNIIKINFECFRPERECPELADPHHGQVSYTGRHFQVFTRVLFGILRN